MCECVCVSVCVCVCVCVCVEHLCTHPEPSCREGLEGGSPLGVLLMAFIFSLVTHSSRRLSPAMIDVWEKRVKGRKKGGGGRGEKVLRTFILTVQVVHVV